MTHDQAQNVARIIRHMINTRLLPPNLDAGETIDDYLDRKLGLLDACEKELADALSAAQVPEDPESPEPPQQTTGEQVI